MVYECELGEIISSLFHACGMNRYHKQGFSGITIDNPVMRMRQKRIIFFSFLGTPFIQCPNLWEV